MESFRTPVLLKPNFLRTKRLLLLFKSHLKVTIGRLSPMLRPIQALNICDQAQSICRSTDVFKTHQLTRAVLAAFSSPLNFNSGSAI